MISLNFCLNLLIGVALVGPAAHARVEPDPYGDVPALAARRFKEAEVTPKWVKRLRERPVGTYFPIATLLSAEARAAARTTFVTDTLRLLAYFEREGDEELRPQVEARLRRFADKLDYRTVARVMRDEARQPRAIAAWTLEGIIARTEFNVIRGGGDVFERTWNLLRGKHLRGATPRAIQVINAELRAWIGDLLSRPLARSLSRFVPVAGVVGTSALGLWTVQHFFHTDFLTGFVLGAVQVGVLGPLTSAATGWLLTPTTDFLKLWNQRFTGEAEQAITVFFNSLRMGALNNVEYDSMRIAIKAEDKGDVAGMTPEQQVTAMDKALRMFVSVWKTFGRLYTDGPHHGRSLVTMMWPHEVQTAEVAQSFQKHLVDLNTNDETHLLPYRTVLLQNGEVERNNGLTKDYRHVVEVLTKQPWHDLTGENARDARLAAQAAMRKLTESYGIPEYVVGRLVENQRRAAELTHVMVTTLAINELRFLFYPETNRNMEPVGRHLQRQVRQNLLLQEMVDRYEGDIQAIHRVMGFPNGCVGALAAGR